MCGRFSLISPLEQLLPRLGSLPPPGLRQHYAPRLRCQPGEPVLVLRQEHGGIGAGLMLWGLLPEWSKDPLGRHGAEQRPFNARSETVSQKPSFRGPWRHRRCLLPADGFYEKGRWIRRQDCQPFWLAGIWDRWIGPDGSEVESCCVLTCAANALLRPLHNRMPVIVADGLEQPWLEPQDGPGLRALEPLLAPWDPQGWELAGGSGQPGPQQLSLLP
jgi:putative SOS response-associated peptidase YedK